MSLIILGLSLLLPGIYALTCSSVAKENEAICAEILQSNATQAEKLDLIGDLAYSGKNIANHSFIYDWNAKINFDSAPEGVEVRSEGYIKDAWLKIIAIMPSVISEGRLLTPGYGKVFTKYNYKVEIPSGTEGGDCKTEFSLASESASLNVYLNNDLIGSSTLADYQGYGGMNFKSALQIQAVIEVKHYNLKKYCCIKGKKGCLQFCEDCAFSNSESRTNQIGLEDYKNAFVYKPVIKPKVKAIDNYRSTQVGILNISNFNAFRLVFENSSLNQYNFYYDINVSIPPYDVFTLRANNFTKIEANNLNVEQLNDTYRFYIANPKKCKLKYFDHFRAFEENCDLKANFPEFTLETDKLQYDEDELVNVSLEPKNALIKVKYGPYEEEGMNFVQFTAKPNINKITAFLDERKAEKVIHVKKKDTWDFALNLGVFSGVLYFYYLLVKKYWGGLL